MLEELKGYRLEDGPVPLYYQLQDLLRELIEDGRLREGEKLPSERELAEYFGINRRTVSRAVENLVREGYAQRRRGEGSFVTSRRLIRQVDWLNSFHDEVHLGGLEPGMELLELKKVVASASVSRYLELAKDQEVYNLIRIGKADSRRVSLQNSFLPAALLPDLEKIFDESRSLYEVLEYTYGQVPHSGRERLQATTLTDYEARLLDSREGKPAFIVRRVTYNRQGTPVEYVKSVLRGDQYEFRTGLQQRRTETSGS